jgi:hypothetical protein
MRRFRRSDKRSLDETIAQLAEEARARGATEEQISRAVSQGTQESGSIVARELERRMPRMVREHRRLRRRFERRLRKTWGRGLDLYYATYVSCLEAGEEFNRKLPRPPNEPHLADALVRLHARSCVIAAEVYELMRTGHPNGAMARARTLHEHAVTAYVLAEGTDEDAEGYLLHAAIENYRRAPVFQAAAQHLNYEPFSDDEMDEMRRTRDALVVRFGADFASQYGWASAIVGKPNPTFRDLELRAGISHLRPYYQWYSDAVHAGAKAAEAAVHVQGGQPVLLAGQTDVGLADPAQSAMFALSQVTTTFLLTLRPPTFEILLQLVAIQRLADRASEALIEAHRKVEPEDDVREIGWPEDAMPDEDA